jgi:hypothetical protein
MFENGRPRYWIGWYDRWHLILPVLLAGAAVALWMQPRLPVTDTVPPVNGRYLDGSGVGLRPSGGGGPSTPLGSATPFIPTQMRPTTLESPQNGKGFFQSRLSDAEGRAEPGSTVYLDYADQDLVWHGLGTMTADAEGRYRFQLRNFPPGHYRLRARAVTPTGQVSESGENMITITPDPTKAPRTARRRAPRK